MAAFATIKSTMDKGRFPVFSDIREEQFELVANSRKVSIN